MKISVLLPTRNGGSLLSDCITSVLDQKYSEIELVISDNCSDAETAATIQPFLGDPRVKYVRQEKLIPVSENWTRALEASSGDYFVMMGDDDCLLPNYFDRMAVLLKEFSYPDCIHYLGYLFVMNGVIEGGNGPRYDPSWGIWPPTQGLIPRTAREEFVRSFFDLRSHCQFNSQLVLVSRKFAETLTRGFYVEPYPDFYSMCALLLEAERFVFTPLKAVVVGVSPKSAGSYYFNRRKGFDEYLGNSSGEKAYSPMLNSILGWLAVLKSRYGDRIGELKIEPSSLARYLVLEQCQGLGFGEIGISTIAKTAKDLRMRDRVNFVLPRVVYHYLLRCRRWLTGGPSAASVAFRRCVPFMRGGIGEFARAVERGEVAR